jgi:hypothetical protein
LRFLFQELAKPVPKPFQSLFFISINLLTELIKILID